MFGLFNNRDKKKKNATIFVANQMASIFLQGSDANEFILDKFVDSPYHSGFVQGKMGSHILALVQNRELREDEANHVSGMVLTYALGEKNAKILSQTMNSYQNTYIKQKSSEWRLGLDRGAKLGRYMNGFLDYKKEPELSKALTRAETVIKEHNQVFPEKPMPSHNSLEKAIVGLKAIWFFDFD